MKLQAQFEAFLSSGNLVGLVEQMKAEGFNQLEIYDSFEEFRAILRKTHREQDENVVMDIMDRLVGWCSPNAKLFTQSLSNEEIDAYRKRKAI